MIAREEDETAAMDASSTPEGAVPEESAEELTPLEGDQLKSTIEAILFASPEPVSRRRLQAMRMSMTRCYRTMSLNVPLLSFQLCLMQCVHDWWHSEMRFGKGLNQRVSVAVLTKPLNCC